MGHQLEHTETVDDNPLPDAEEIIKLNAIDPEILPWLKSRAGQEQDFRHEAHMERIHIVAANEQNTRVLNTLGLCFAFIIFLCGMAFSAYLISKDHTITGTVFCGATLVSGASLFINRMSSQKKQEGSNTPSQQ